MNVIALVYDYDNNKIAYDLIDGFKPNNIECVHEILSPLSKEYYTIKTVEMNRPKPKGLGYYVENSGIDIANQTGYANDRPIYETEYIDNITPTVFVS
jgi:hypothetical protein